MPPQGGCPGPSHRPHPPLHATAMRVENFSLKTFDFRHSAGAHLCPSRGTLVGRGTQVGKLCNYRLSSRRSEADLSVAVGLVESASERLCREKRYRNG